MSSHASSIPPNVHRRTMLSIREKLVMLHGALIVAEQQTYERLNGAVESVDRLLQLLQNDPWFTWLHPIADLLVRIDLLLEDTSHEIIDVNVEHLLKEIDGLLYPSPEGDGFARAYFEAIERSPEVADAHFLIRKLHCKAA